MASLRPALVSVAILTACSFDSTGQVVPGTNTTPEQTASTSGEEDSTGAVRPTSTVDATGGASADATTEPAGPTGEPTSESSSDPTGVPGAVCGNDEIEGSEACDGVDLGGQSCADFGMVDGALACAPDCTVDSSGCEAGPSCGDGAVDVGEACDGAELAGETCESLQFYGGTLACAGDCVFDTVNCLTEPADWFDKKFKKRRKLTIPAAVVDGSLTEFPVVVTFDAGEIAGLGPADRLLFADTDKTALSHELEFADAQHLVVWVKLPEISDASDTVFYVYYDNPDAKNTGDAKGTWAADFLAVWHLGESVVDGEEGGMHLDSTEGGRTGVQHDNATAELADCRLGRCQEFGASEWIDIEKDGDFKLGNVDASIAAWVYSADAASMSRAIFAKSNPANPTNTHIIFGLSASAFGDNLACEQQGSGFVYGPGVSRAAWHHVVWTQTKDFMATFEQWSLYVDGALVTQTVLNGAATQPAHYARIGGPTANSNYPGNFLGFVDEVEVSLATRSPDWVATSYQNQRDPAMFTLVGDEESL